MCSRQRLAACRGAARGAPSRPAAGAIRSSRPVRRIARSRPVACSDAERAAQQPEPLGVREQREDQAAQRLVLRRCARGCARPGRGSARSGCRTARPTGRRSRRPCSRGRRPSARPSSRSSARPRDPPSSGRSGRAGSPSPRPTARRSGRSAGRSRSARSHRSARRPAGGARRRRRRERACRGRRCCPSRRGCRPCRARWCRSCGSDSSHEAARREPVVGVELVLDAAHQVERRDRSPHVDGRP